ncbi:MAG: ABC transporter permease [Proteobacteria bacterium]|nr:ABC transporter permease [Pseudomonadota bacterium]HQR03895.1 permease-like cell division protein FtsX [Rhodocyclaceae bacterium]
MNAWLTQHRHALMLSLGRLAATPLNTLLSILAMGIALALPAGGQLLLDNARLALGGATAPPQISVFLALDASQGEVAAIGQRLAATPGVSAFRMIPRAEALSHMRATEGLAAVLDSLPDNPFPDAYVVTPRDDAPHALEQLATDISAWSGVAHVQLDSAWARRLDALLRLGRAAVGLLAGLLGIGVVAITFNIIRLQVLTQRGEIEVSRLLGATDSFIRRPFLWFGLLQGLLGGLTAWALVFAATLALRGPVTDLASLYGLHFVLHGPGPEIATLWLGLAASLGWLGAGLSLRQYLRSF